MDDKGYPISPELDWNTLRKRCEGQCPFYLVSMIFGGALALSRTFKFSQKVTPNGHSPADCRTFPFSFFGAWKFCAEQAL
jgi:hypothetical protein